MVTSPIIPFLRPPFGAEERTAAMRVMLGNNVSIGPETQEFERKFCEYIGADACLSVCNGSIALDLIWQTYLRTGRLKKGDKVLLPSFTFVAVPNSVVNAGLVPVFCDIDKGNWNLSPIIEDIFKCKALVAVHTFGNPCKIDSLKEWCDHYGTLLVEDCAEACGAVYKGKKVGSFGDAAAFSFNATKNMTTGEGGMVAFNGDDDELPEYAEFLKENGFGAHGKRSAVIPGYNWRLSNIQCAIGIEQLKTLDARNQKRIKNAYKLYDTLPLTGLVQFVGEGCVYQIFGILLENRDKVYEHMINAGVECKKYFDPPCHAQTYYHENYVWPDFPNTDEISSKILCLPMYPSLTDEDIKYMVSKLSEVV